MSKASEKLAEELCAKDNLMADTLCSMFNYEKALNSKTAYYSFGLVDFMVLDLMARKGLLRMRTDRRVRLTSWGGEVAKMIKARKTKRCH